MSAVLTMELLQKADCFLDTDTQHQAAGELGKKLFEAFGSDKGRISTQARNLQQMAVSATRLADIEDFVKNQMGKEKPQPGQPRKWRRVGEAVLKQLATLRAQAATLANDEDERLLLRLHLARGWARAVIGAYLYAKACKEMEGNHA
jgi:hypothetical protein